MSYAFTPYDARTGHGYGHLRNKGLGSPRGSGDEYPYGSGAPSIRDAYPEEELDEEETDEELQAKFATKLGTQQQTDHLGRSMNVYDRSSLAHSSNRFTLWQCFVPPGEPIVERIYTPDARSGPLAPRVSGTKHGYASPDIKAWEIDDPIMSLEDLDEDDPDERALKSSIRAYSYDLTRS